MSRFCEKSKELCFVDPKDQETDECLIEELYFAHIARCPIHILNHAASNVNIYGEPSGDPVYDVTFEDVPVHIELDPEAEILDRYGYDRNRNALIAFSIKILRDLSLSPKVGDRIDFKYLNELDLQVTEHLIINEISPWDFVRQQKTPYQVIAAADRTHKLFEPLPPGPSPVPTP